MAVQLLAIASGEAVSAEFTIPGGEVWTVCLNDSQGPVTAHGALVRIDVKDPDGRFFEIGTLVSDHTHLSNWMVLSASGTYRLRRYGTVECGVFALN